MIKKIIIASIIILWCCSAIAQEREVTEKQTPAIEKSSSESKQDDSECEFKLESCGLIVTCKDLPTNVSWDNSMMKYCPKGWRLPTLEELQCMQQNIPYSYGKIYWCSIETEKKRNAYTVRLKDGETKKTAKIMVLGISYGKEMPLTKKSIYYVKEY